MKITDIQKRREIYWQLYFVMLMEPTISFKNRNGMCWTINKLGNFFYPGGMKWQFPELYAQRPNHDRPWWWHWTVKDYKKRRAAILKAIQLTYP